MLFFGVLILFCGCSNLNSNPVITQISIDISDADIVFNSINDETHKDMLGFYAFENHTVKFVDIGWNTILPNYVASKTLIMINKKGYPGDYLDRDGNLMIINKMRLIRCGTDETYGRFIKNHEGNILFNSPIGVVLINPADCSVVEKILPRESGIVDYSAFYNQSMDLTKDGNFMIVNNGTNLIKLNLLTHEIEDYGINGDYPSISPDQKRVIFLGPEGIYVMDIGGITKELIIPYNSKNEDYYRGNPPKPNWSPDGSSLVYHKCKWALGSCDDIKDYDIFIYDFKTKEEELIVEGGMNPSWNFYK